MAKEKSNFVKKKKVFFFISKFSLLFHAPSFSAPPSFLFPTVITCFTSRAQLRSKKKSFFRHFTGSFPLLPSILFSVKSFFLLLLPLLFLDFIVFFFFFLGKNSDEFDFEYSFFTFTSFSHSFVVFYFLFQKVFISFCTLHFFSSTGLFSPEIFTSTTLLLNKRGYT